MVGPVFAPAGAQIGWLVLAVVLHVCGQVSRGVAWRGVLAATWPEVTRRRACAWYVCGAGLSGVLSPRGGDAVRVTLARRELRDATWPALAGTLCAEASFETVSGLTMMLVGRRARRRQPPRPAGHAARGRRARGGGGGAPRRALRAGASHGARGRPRRRRAAQARALRAPRAALPGGRARAAPRLGDVLPARLRTAGGARHRRRRGHRARLRRRDAAPWRRAWPPSALRCSSPCRSPPGTRSTAAPWHRWPSPGRRRSRSWA